METRVKVFGKSQNRIALGIINAYLDLYPESSLKDLQKAFPDTINPDCGGKQLFMTEKDINTHLEKGENWYASARGYFVNSGEWLVMPDGECVAFVSMWTKPSLDRLVEHAKQYGIEVVESDEKKGSFRIEHIKDNMPAKKDDDIIENIKKTTENIIESASTAVEGVTKFIGEKISSIKKGHSDTNSKKEMNSFVVTYEGKEYPMALQYKMKKNESSEYYALTNELDMLQGNDLKPEDIYKITLWKIGRFPFITTEILNDLNSLRNEKTLNVEKTKAVLNELLNTTGVGLPMASTYLRFINPDVYQIIDVRAYRAAFDYKKNKNDYTNARSKIDVYLSYLKQLRDIAESDYHGLSTEFRNLDRFLFNFDKHAVKLSNLIKNGEDDSDEEWENTINMSLEDCDEITNDDVNVIKNSGLYDFVVSYDDCNYSMSLQYKNTGENSDKYPDLTDKLDKLQGKELTMEDIYKITLWKIGRFPFMTPETLANLNSLKGKKTLDVEKTTDVLNELLDTKGIGLPMASAYLRFINPDVYQIIDVRAYRTAFEYEREETDYKYEDNEIKVETYFEYLEKLREIAESDYHGLSTEFRNLDRFLYNFDKTTGMRDQELTDDCWKKAIRLSLEKCNINGFTPIAQEKIQAEKKSNKNTHTYKLRIETESLYKLEVCGLKNADDDVIEDGFENEDRWVEIVGNTLTLGMQMGGWKENIGNDYYDEDTEPIETILNMVDDGDNDAGVDNNGCFPDAEEEFQIIVMDEDEEEIETIDGSDINMFEVTDGHTYLADFIEDDCIRQMANDYLKKNNLLDSRCDDFGLYQEGWTWVNVQHGETLDFPVYELITDGPFDPEKLLIIKNMVNDSLGDCCIEAITKVIYDGEELEASEDFNPSDLNPSEGQTLNLFVKRENPSEEVSADLVYNMSTMEKS